MLDLAAVKVLMPDILAALPERENRVLTALHWEGLTLGQIAKREDVDKTTVLRVRDRAYARIRGLVE